MIPKDSVGKQHAFHLPNKLLDHAFIHAREIYSSHSKEQQIYIFFLSLSHTYTHTHTLIHIQYNVGHSLGHKLCFSLLHLKFFTPSPRYPSKLPNTALASKFNDTTVLRNAYKYFKNVITYRKIQQAIFFLQINIEYTKQNKKQNKNPHDYLHIESQYICLFLL